MTTREIARHLARATKHFPYLGQICEQDFIDLVKWELGHEEILDDFQIYAGHFTMARGPESILHIISGNTPHAGIQSLVRGLLLKARNFCKIPSAGLPDIEQFRDALPEELSEQVEISGELLPHWLKRSEAMIVFGDDNTVSHFRNLARPDQRCVFHGHKISFGIVFEDPRYESVEGAARDASLFDQQGCLSPHVFYVKESQLTAREYGARLARGMEVINNDMPRSKLTTQEAILIRSLRQKYEFRASNGEPVAVWKSEYGTDWTVVFDANPHFTASCLNRVIFVKPLPIHLDLAIARVSGYLSTISIWPPTLENARAIQNLGATRICRIGNMQDPHFTWHQDGGQNLAPLVRWIDFENA